MLHVFSLPAPASPVAFWRAVHPRPRNGFLLGSGARTRDDRFVYLSLTEPAAVLAGDADQAPRFLRKIQRHPDPRDAFPRYVGYLGFDAGRGFDPGIRRLPRRRATLPFSAVHFGDHRSVARIDGLTGRMDVAVRGTAAQALTVRRAVEAALAVMSPSLPPPRRRKEKVRVASARRFAAMVARAKSAIAAGDIYQANISLRFDRAFAGDPIDLYEELCRRNPSPYAALLRSPGGWIVSCSPELLLDVSGRRAVTRPIAGTRPRGRDDAHDRRTSGQLLLSPKERAEHIMLVDLERNDLGRVCETGSVRVTERMGVERYSHVMHIVSQVEGRLARGRTAADAIAASFPGGTITGCPKIRSIELIEDIERESRSIFYGSAGYVCGNGDAKLNILIRTAAIRRGRLTLRAGAGIVADSRAASEYREVFAKARAVLEAADRV